MNFASAFALLWLAAVAPGSALRFHAEENDDSLGAYKDEAYWAEIDNKLWDGLDLDDAAATMMERSSQFKKQLGIQSLKKDSKNLIFMGPFDAGTHLIRALMVHNFEAQWNETCEAHAFAKKENALKAHCGVWKHGLDDAHSFRSILKNKGFQPENVIVLVMVRSPISQIASWRNDAWDIAECVNRTWSELSTPCQARIGWPASGEEPNAMIDFSSATDVYNHYLRMYQRLKADPELGGVAMTTYEDVVMNPKKAIFDIAQTFGWKNSEPIDADIMKKSQKFQSNGRDAAMKKLESRSFLDELEPQDLEKICQKLDHEAIHDLAEGKYSDKPRPYNQDCKDFNSKDKA